YKNSEIRIFELHICKRCGQPYLFGNISEDGYYIQKENVSYYSDEKNYFFMLIDYDELDEYEDLNAENIWKICVACGKLLRKGSCTCEMHLEIPIKKIEGKGNSLTQCKACEYSSYSVNRFLMINRDTLSAVIATNLYQNASYNEKLLTFTDNRQKAAFFAPFLEFTYELILFRHLILKTIKELEISDLRLEGLSIKLQDKCRQHDIFPSELDDVQKKLTVWRHIINEFYNISSRNSLEALGLIRFSIKFPDNWNPPDFLKKEPWGLSFKEIKFLYQVLLNTLRKSKAFSMPPDGPRYNDEIFERFGNKKQWFFKGELRENEKGRGHQGLISFIPRRKVNSRIDFLKKILERKKPNFSKAEILKLSENTLINIWEDIFTNWIAKCQDDIFYAYNSTYQLNYQFWNVAYQNIDDLYICNKCGHITHLNIENVCPTYRCKGILIQDKKKIENFHKNNHFVYLYNNFKPKKLRAKEHTAQLTTEKATKTQINFIFGKIDLLSCSTTFELGVDLGELQIIFLTNIPPDPSNYVQRAGRAGRRRESAGFIVSLAQQNSHDLTYFNNPIKMINGYIKPPVISIKNEKIILRHINSLILSKFFKNKPEYYYGNESSEKVKAFLFNTECDPKSCYFLILSFIENNFNNLIVDIKQILPEGVDHNKLLNKEVILNNLFSESYGKFTEYGKLYLANLNITSEVKQLENLKDEYQKKYTLESSYKERNKIHYFIQWIHRRIHTIKNEPLINFLSRNSIIPKYGFPVDVVKLEILHKDQSANEINLERDLRIAISEYAPGSLVVANGKIWKSAGLKVFKNQTWPIYEYLFCPNCEQFNIRPYFKSEYNNSSEFRCINCNLELENLQKYKFIDPIFGFLTDRNQPPLKPGKQRPEREFFSRPFFHSLTPIKKGYFETIEKVKNVLIEWEYAPNGELTVLCRGKKEKGFIICYECGRAWNKKPKNNHPHETPYGYKCNGVLHYGVHLGHQFQTDILKLTFKCDLDNHIRIDYSLLYALLEGIADELQINRSDIDGCLFNKNEEINDSLIIFDKVPGGAGHVKRVIESEDIFIKIINSAIKKLDSCKCGVETSCYGCIRNYSNQFCHEKLSRGMALETLRKIYPEQ
ncbi:MAG: Zn-binding domain-containing protein, partial [Promethearchaeota archaeon]